MFSLLRVAADRPSLCRRLMLRTDCSNCRTLWAATQPVLQPSLRPISPQYSVPPAVRALCFEISIFTRAAWTRCASSAVHHRKTLVMATSAAQKATDEPQAPVGADTMTASQSAAAPPAAAAAVQPPAMPASGGASPHAATSSGQPTRKQRAASPQLQGEGGHGEGGCMKLGKRKVALHIAYLGTAFRGTFAFAPLPELQIAVPS